MTLHNDVADLISDADPDEFTEKKFYVAERVADPTPLRKKKKHKKRERPGSLQGSISFAIHTHDAQLLFSGYTSSPAIGLLQFSSQMATIWDAASNDDPYADWYLLKIYEEILKLRNELAVMTYNQQQKISQTYDTGTLNLMPFPSQEPLIETLWFRTQYGYLAASLIADFDLLMRTVLTAYRVGVLLEQSHVEIKNEWINKISALFQLAFKWQATAVTRADIYADNDLAKATKELLGDIPAKILNKSLRAEFAPTITRINNAPTIN